MAASEILHWLKTIPSTPASPSNGFYEAPPRKRPRLHPPTPQSSNALTDEMSFLRKDSPHKRHELDEVTPRASRKRPQTQRSECEYSLPSSLTRSQSQHSGRLSPQKHLNDLERSEHGIRIREIIGLQDVQPPLASLLVAMRKISRGRGIIPLSMRVEFEQLAQSHPHLVDIATDDACFDPGRDQAGHTPSPELVFDVIAEAVECQENFHAEATWNMTVHRDILKLALRTPDQGPFDHLTNFMACSTASVIPDYLPFASPSKKVDFCIYIEPTAASAFASYRSSALPWANSAITAARDQLPCGVINHTTYYPLRERPIALSIETKKTGEGWEGATLQLGVWQAAQWNLLRHLASLSSTAEQNKVEGTNIQDEAEAPMEKDKRDEAAHKMASPETVLPHFLPGIIIQGHEWYFVVSTKVGDQAVVWSKITMGATNSAMGIYQIVFGLQTLRKWAEVTYWPIVRDLILAVGRGPGE